MKYLLLVYTKNHPGLRGDSFDVLESVIILCFLQQSSLRILSEYCFYYFHSTKPNTNSFL